MENLTLTSGVESRGGQMSRSKAASPLSSSHQGPDTGNKKLAQRIQEKLKPSVERMFKDTCEGVAKPGKHTPSTVVSQRETVRGSITNMRLPLDFQHNKILSDVKETSSVDVLLTNLIKGNLLPFALLWITSRPAAANRIPPQYFHRLTEVHGFNNPQKEQYFKKRFRDPDLASTVISHIKASRSLNMMCHIPLFCWISATVLEKVLDRPDIGEIPKTVTEMYTLFLLIRYTNKRKKEDDGNETETQKLDKSVC
ncbi:hypothetical protein AAFF_G00323610 [Aldrovandia affinis]|uniref:NACHT domain-containing protein n=1 Tax=Aldrovandia affinis TaxID=143900 RepID=A0AAD7W0A7_9TELE|nr:hypothetical protein AAFF_G00323610 [Aldrovandia affinis]